MKIGFVGLGKMGGNMVERLLKGGHEIVVLDRSSEAVETCVKKGAKAARDPGDMCKQLGGRKAVWLMVPAGAPVDENIAAFAQHMSKGDIIIDGGNSNWRDTQKRCAQLETKGMNFVDCGTSGGVWGLKNGYCLMYGGDKEACKFLEPVFTTLAPPKGHLYCGKSGGGHFVKMVHNGIEYGMMQAYAEGFEILDKSPYSPDLRAVSELWMQGSVVRSWLLELMVIAFAEDPKLAKIKGFVNDSGEGRWTIQAAIDFDVPAPVITASLFERFHSRQPESFAAKCLAALRNQFGGHAVKTS